MVTLNSRLDEPVSFPKDKSEWHSFLDGNVDTATKIRTHVENLPKTAATFNIRDIDGVRPQGLEPALIKLTGAWPCPDIVTNNRNRKWVNPNYAHAQHYSDAVVRCGCGIPVLRQSFGENENQPSHHQEHNQDCNKIHRKKAELELLKNRRDIITDAYQHGHSMSAVSQRLGYPEAYHVGTNECRNWGLEIDELAREGREKVARSAMVLCREHSPKKVAPLFGMTRKSLSEIVTKETKSDASMLYSVRRAV